MPENYPAKIRRQIEAAQAAGKGHRHGYDAKRGGYFFELLPDPPTCGAKAKTTGAACRLTVEFEGVRCRFHGGFSTGPRTDAGRAAIADANRRRKGTRYRVAMPDTPIKSAADLIALTPAQRRQWAQAESDRRRAAPAPLEPSPPPRKAPRPTATAPTATHPQAQLLAALLAMTPEQRATVEANLRAQLNADPAAPKGADT